MKISVHGCGYLGAVHAACMAELGHDVIGIDIDGAKVESLGAGVAPFFEPGFPEVLGSAIASRRLQFSTDAGRAAGARIHFLAVGTPQQENGTEADLSYLHAAVDALVPHLVEGDLVVGKSTVPVGTARSLAARVAASGAIVAWNPEFLREGFAVADTVGPDRIVYGLPEGDAGERARALLDEVYATAIAAGAPVIATDYATAELVKMSANAFLATKISFINAMSEIAAATGADVTELADAIGHDVRIGRRFLNAGAGFGGGCLPKDIRSFVAQAEKLGHSESLAFLKEVDAINLRQRERVIALTAEALGGEVAGKTVALLGLAFKPNSDDIRDSPALDVALGLQRLGANVIATDPQAVAKVKRAHPLLAVTEETGEALRGADVVVVVTEWDEFRSLEPRDLARLVRGRAIVDGRNCLDPRRWSDAGWSYSGMGRISRVPQSDAADSPDLGEIAGDSQAPARSTMVPESPALRLEPALLSEQF